MGCVQTKGISCSPQSSTLERLKHNNDYVKVENSGRLRGGTEAAEASGGSGGERRITRESERKHGGGNFTQRISVKKIVAVDETVDGWPKWLVENVKGDVLAGLVPKSADSSLQEMETATSSSSTSSAPKSSSSGRRHSPPPSPTPAAFRSQLSRAAKTEAHPNALKNIKNYPLLLASLTEAANHLKESNSSLYRRSISHIDFRDLDLEKISKLFGVDDN